MTQPDGISDPSPAARPDRTKEAMLAMAKLVNEAAKREREMWLRFVRQVNEITRGRVAK